MLYCLFLAALLSPAWKGLTSWLFCVCDVFLCFCDFPIWCPGSGVVFICIDSWPLPSFLLWKVLDKHAPSQDRGLVDIQNVIATGMIQIIKL